MLEQWATLPSHGEICLALAPGWYVPILAAALAVTVVDYLMIGALLVAHATQRAMPLARRMAWLYGVFVFSCGLAHAAGLAALFVGGRAYVLLLVTVLLMALASTLATVATLTLWGRANEIARNVDRAHRHG